MKKVSPSWATFLGCCYQLSNIPNSSNFGNNILGLLCLWHLYTVLSLFHHLESIKKRNFPSTLTSFSVCRVVIPCFIAHEHTSTGHTTILHSLTCWGFWCHARRHDIWRVSPMNLRSGYTFIFSSVSVSHLARWLVRCVFLYSTFVFCPHWHCFGKASLFRTVFAH